MVYWLNRASFLLLNGLWVQNSFSIFDSWKKILKKQQYSGMWKLYEIQILRNRTTPICLHIVCGYFPTPILAETCGLQNSNIDHLALYRKSMLTPDTYHDILILNT